MKKQHAATAALVARAHKTKGKSRNKTHKSELEAIREENRTLKSIVRNLKKELAAARKNNKKVEDLEEMIQDEVEPMVNNDCPECGGQLYTVDMGPKKLTSCPRCLYRRIE